MSDMPRVILPDGLPMTEEPAPLTSRSPTRLFGGRGLLAVPQQRERDTPIYVPLVPDQIRGMDVTRKWTQEDQDETDKKARKKALNDLVASWMDRLQLISVITTFFAAMESQLLGSTAPGGDDRQSEPLASQIANAALIGALVVHVFAAILSFLAAFFLIRYKLTAAKREERKVESGLADSATNANSAGSNSRGSADNDASRSTGSRSTASSASQPIWSSNPHLEQVGPFRRGLPPTHLLDHCHSLCMWLSAVGFVLALAGVLGFSWS